MSSSPTVSRLQLGRELRRLRETAGLGRDAAATELECDVSKISKIETGKATLRPAEVKALLDRYGVTDRDAVLRLARDARRRSTHRVPDWAKTFVGMEADATEIRTYEAELVPGLLQTEDYARVVTQAADPTRDPREVERMVAARTERQQRLHSPGAPLIWAILNEAVIRRQVGDKEIIGRQLEHLAALGADPNITIQVLPFTAGAHPAMGSSFVHLRLADPPDAEIIYLEDMASSDYLPHPAQIASYLTAFGTLAHTALDPAASTIMIKNAALGE
ncbi:MAG TPA: helix-turn-helix transcriptional regulator [Pseudonocardiaceae bacterium]|nr:helix-turn-helix transcriptional regulator [Pseudonocardiaceae bacterium]